VLEAIGRFQAQGLIRRLGATLWHQRSGFAANSLVVFQVAPEKAPELGARLAEKPYVSHCYLRRTAPGWPFNLYAMTHAESRGELELMILEMAELVGAEQWRRLDSLRELKKASLRYFTDRG
jgi:DNA-binding Lrp family transcriptional regulator